MSFMGKLAFWKKKDDFSDLSKDPFQTDIGSGDPFGPGTSQGPDPLAGPEPVQRPFGDLPDPGQYRSQGIPPHQGFSDANSFTADKQSGYSTFSRQQPAPSAGHSEFEMVNAKLDAIRAQLESLNTRLLTIERIAQAEQQQGDQQYRW